MFSHSYICLGLQGERLFGIPEHSWEGYAESETGCKDVNLMELAQETAP